jgi:hypothetical protein
MKGPDVSGSASLPPALLNVTICRCCRAILMTEGNGTQDSETLEQRRFEAAVARELAGDMC